LCLWKFEGNVFDSCCKIYPDVQRLNDDLPYIFRLIQNKLEAIPSSGATSLICGQKLYTPPSCAAQRGNVINMTRICGQKVKFPSCLARQLLYHVVISFHQDERQPSINHHTQNPVQALMNDTLRLNFSPYMKGVTWVSTLLGNQQLVSSDCYIINYS